MATCKEDCPNEVLAHGWCRKHYLRWYKHGDPTIKLNRWGEDRDAETKTCSVCKKELPVDAFYKHTTTRRPMSKCKSCYKPSPEKKQEMSLRKYGITLQQYKAMLSEQDGGCAICGSVPAEGDPRLSVDHDHATGKVRGLLCYGCNAGIGMFKDDPELLTAAITYLAVSASAQPTCL